MPTYHACRATVAALALMGEICVSAVLAGCSSSTDSTPVHEDITPVRVSASSDRTPLAALQKIDTSSLRAAQGTHRFTITGMASGNTSPKVNLIHWPPNGANDPTIENFNSYDVDNDSFTQLFSMPALQSPGVDRDGTAGVHLDECDAYFHAFDTGSNAVLINPYLQDLACPRPMSLSDHGDTIAFRTARGQLDENGRLKYAGFDESQYSHVVYRPAEGSVLDLSVNALPIGDATLDQYSRSLVLHKMSSDGRRLLYTGYFMPDINNTEMSQDYIVGPVLVKLDSSSIQLLNKNKYIGPACTRCGLGGQDDSALSGDGKVVYYLKSVAASSIQNPAASQLLRLELDSGNTQTIKLEQAQRSALVTNHNGSQVAFLSGGTVLVYNADTRTLLDINSAMQFCVGGDCLFDSYRFVRHDPLMFSAEGNALLINVIPERASVQTPQNTQELIYLDTQSGVLHRVAPEADVSFFAISDDGRIVAFNSETPNLVAGDDGFNEDIFIIRR